MGTLIPAPQGPGFFPLRFSHHPEAAHPQSQALGRARAGDRGPGLGKGPRHRPKGWPQEERWPVWSLRAQAGEEGRASACPWQPLIAPEGRPLWVLLNHQKLNLLLHGNFCEVRV